MTRSSWGQAGRADVRGGRRPARPARAVIDQPIVRERSLISGRPLQLSQFYADGGCPEHFLSSKPDSTASASPATSRPIPDFIALVERHA